MLNEKNSPNGIELLSNSNQHMSRSPSSSETGILQNEILNRLRPRTFANPAPLGLSAFAMTSFVLALINLRARDVTEPNLVVALAYSYGGLIQLLAGMWEFANGNTFGAIAFSSYGGLWLSFAIIFTPGGFNIAEILSENGPDQFYDSFGFYLLGWTIFTMMLTLCTLRTSLMFFLTFVALDGTFLILAIAYLAREDNEPRISLIKAGGAWGLTAAVLAWYNAFAGIATHSNTFFTVPVFHFPWSEEARKAKLKPDTSAV